MITISFRTKKDQESILNEAVEYFAKNVGLKIAERSRCCVFFGDYPSNYVRVTLSQEDEKSEVVVESREFEYQAKRFVEEFKGKV